MTEKKYTDEEIIRGLEFRMHRDALCREAYDLINRLKNSASPIKCSTGEIYCGACGAYISNDEYKYCPFCGGEING